MSRFRDLIERLREFDRLANISEIARRYFAMNAFDGVLTIIGVLMGNLAVDVDRPEVVVSTGLATSVAMGISGLWGAYLTETAERRRELLELERYTLMDLNDTLIQRASRAAVVTVAIVDGLSPFLAAVVVLIPFFGVELFPTIAWAYYTSLALALLTLFLLGLFLGAVSRSNLIVSGIKTVVAGVAAIVVNVLLGV